MGRGGGREAPPDAGERVVALRKAVGYDGYDLDWEPVPPADEPALLALFRALRAADPGALLTMPVNWLATGTAAVSGCTPSSRPWSTA